MKRVSFKDVGEFKARDIVIKVLETTPEGIKFADMNKRLKVLEAIEDTPDGDVMMEDAVFETLKKVLENFPFANCKLDLVRMLHGILSVKDVEVPKIPMRNDN